MEIESPKVQDNPKNPEDKSIQLCALIDSVFNQNEDGKKLLEALKELFISNRVSALTFPIQRKDLIDYFGNSVEAYIGFKEGQKNIIFLIEEQIEVYKNLDNHPKPTK